MFQPAPLPHANNEQTAAAASSAIEYITSYKLIVLPDRSWEWTDLKELITGVTRSELLRLNSSKKWSKVWVRVCDRSEILSNWKNGWSTSN